MNKNIMMDKDFVTEDSRKIPIIAESDVLVVGGGPSGLAAAISASRMGVKTILIERYGCFGGNITQAMVESIAWYRHEHTVEAGGIGREFEERAKKMGGTIKDPESIGELLDTEFFKYVADQMVIEAGVIPILHCFAVDVIMEGVILRGVITESKSGRTAIVAKRIIDATGDADIAFRAGAPVNSEPLKNRMAVTTNFACSGVEVEKFLDYLKKHPKTIKDWASKTTGKEDSIYSPYISEPFIRAKEAGEIPRDVCIESYWSGGIREDTGEVTNLNAVHVFGIDTTNVFDLTRAEIEGRKQVIWAIDALKKYMPGFKNARLRNFASVVGTRESRKIIGEYNLTGEDVMNQARFEDSIGICPEFLDAYGIVILPTTGRFFQFPYRSMLPKKIENLLVVGRCVAGDRISHAATRQMVCCTITGQGAGVAAAQSIKEGVTCRNVNISKVQRILTKNGVRVK